MQKIIYNVMKTLFQLQLSSFEANLRQNMPIATEFLTYIAIALQISKYQQRKQRFLNFLRISTYLTTVCIPCLDVSDIHQT